MSEEINNLKWSINEIQNQVDENKKQLDSFISIINESNSEESDYIKNLKISTATLSQRIKELSELLEVCNLAMNKLVESENVNKQIETEKQELLSLTNLLNSTGDESYNIKIMEAKKKINELEELYNQLVDSADALVSEI